MIRLWRFTFCGKWKVVSSLKTVLLKIKFSSSRRSAYRYKSLSSMVDHWALQQLKSVGRKDSCLRSTFHTVMREISHSFLPSRLVNCYGRRRNDARTRYTLSSLARVPEYFYWYKCNQFQQMMCATCKWIFNRCFCIIICTKSPLNQRRWMIFFSNCNTHFAFSTSVKYAILMDAYSAPTSGDHGYFVSSGAELELLKDAQ
jgi:hypothetical protein